MALDHYVTLGRSGLRVSPLCLGTMTFGEDFGWGSSVEESQQIMDRYIDAGGNFLDTANFYTASHSEKIIGDHIGRHERTIATAASKVAATIPAPSQRTSFRPRPSRASSNHHSL